ncbi:MULTISPECIES: glycosyltransferase family 2 protein [unclassified Arcicella]|uniref:glycosyltransferase family 2 protein n=1 Tax=unclassified Arcicella TaxID=2644986 RepID=UPI0028554826|nr:MULTISPECIES: glycosyltransferase family 2 protein [unclassified Arcicella]MDR6562611.1 glycosyltransferase involved in cell wall biosynthesis [Arcicella sp. BE51]MDR6812698.1 glycosyltransferase involved in cell wall biosynthesis [Arcicella sp. BE140]MDR6824010.1 glycosyltransferase involved in cell wall biosynthesis [Arcicella sp. BE139]
MQDISVIILTFNEEKHIKRCVESLLAFTDKIFIVDSGSTDKTVEIAESLGAKVVQRPWVNYAIQFNYGIQNNPYNTTWLMRMDADEYVLPALAEEINLKLSGTAPEIGGMYIKRRVIFFDKWIRHGAYYPIWLLRIWRSGQGACEESWMDEHITLTSGKTIQMENDIVDHNLNNLTWWTQKHNLYAIREVIDLLNIKYNFRNFESVEPNFFGSQEQRTRFLKVKYASIPLFIRPIIYFIYRYIFRFGFLDGKQGFIWHFLQGFWYRFLVDAKVYEVYHRVGKDKKAIEKFFKDEFNKDLTK